MGVLGIDLVYSRTDELAVTGMLATAGVSLTGRRAGYLGLGVAAAAAVALGALAYVVALSKD